MPDPVYVLLKQLMDIENWPVASLLPASLDNVIISMPEIVDWMTPSGFQPANGVQVPKTIRLGMLLSDALKLQLPGFDMVSLSIAKSADSSNVLYFSVALDELSFKLSAPVTLSIDASILCPLKPNSNDPDPDAKTLDIGLGTIDIGINGNGHLILDFDSSGVTVPRCMLCSTGVLLSVGSLRWLNPDSPNPPSGVPSGFTGLFLDGVSAVITQLGDTELDMTDVFIGTGGFSGNISAVLPVKLGSDGTSFSGPGSGTLFDIPFALQGIELEFKQNALVASEIKGAVIFPFFDQPALVDLCLTTGGDFTVALSVDQSLLPPGAVNKGPDGLLVFTKPGLMDLVIKGLSFKHQDSLFLIDLSGSIKPLIGSFTWPELEVKSLSIDSKGHVQIEGGWIDLPQQASFSLDGFSADLTKIGFGNEQDGSRWIGLSGGIKIVDGLAINASVDGLKVSWTSADKFSLSIGGVGIGFEIKDVLQIQGKAVFFRDTDKGESGFKGGVKLQVYSINLSLDVEFMAGQHSKGVDYKFFYVAADLMLPVGIPLLNTSLAIYGFAGLFGYNVEPNKGKGDHPNPEESWYENEDGSPGWYLRPQEGITDAATKWDNNYESMAFGAGIRFGTLSDNGYTFAAKVLLVLLIPGPVIMIEGKGNFLRDRSQLDSNPIFKTLAVFDFRAGTFLMNLDGNIKLPMPDGDVLVVRALAEAFFDLNNTSNWHFYLGEKEKAKRVRASIIEIFEANSYLMLDDHQFATGAWIGYDKNWKFGPLKVVLAAWIEGDASLTFKAFQAEGGLDLDASVELDVFSFSLGLSLASTLEAKAPHPLYLYAALDVEIKLPWPLGHKKAHLELKKEDHPAPPVPLVLAGFGAEHLKVAEKWKLQKYPAYDTDGDGFMDNAGAALADEGGALQIAPVVPLDARPVLTFAKPVTDLAKVGDNPHNPASGEQVGDYSYQYNLTGLQLQRKKGGDTTWSDWPDSSHQLYGKWQDVVDKGQLVNTKLILWGNTSLDYTRELTNNTSNVQAIEGAYKAAQGSGNPRAVFVAFGDCSPHTYLPAAFTRPDGTIFIGNYPVQVVATNNILLNRALQLVGGAAYQPPRQVSIDFRNYPTATFSPNQPFKASGAAFCFPTYSSVKAVNGVTGALLAKNNSQSPPFTEVYLHPCTEVRAKIYFKEACTMTVYDKSGRIVGSQKQDKPKPVQWETATLAVQGREIVRVEFDVAENQCVLLTKFDYLLPEQLPASASRLLATFPEPLYRLDVCLGDQSAVDLTALDENGTVIEKIPSGGPGTVTINGAVRQLQLAGSGLLLYLEYYTASESNRATGCQETDTETNEKTLQHWQSPQDLLEPDTQYKLTATTQVMRSDLKSPWQTFTETAYFQTAKPPGAYLQGPLILNPVGANDTTLTGKAAPSTVLQVNLNNAGTGSATADSNGNFTLSIPQQPEGTVLSVTAADGSTATVTVGDHYPYGGPIKDASVYVNRTMPPDGSKAVYCAYDVAVFFNEHYVDNMYASAALPLTIKLLDNNGQPVLDAGGNEIVFPNASDDSPQVYLTREETQTITIINEQGQVTIEGSNRPYPQQLYTYSLLLKPQTLYQAKLVAGVDSKAATVFSFSFSTSRYATFLHQIQSFQDVAWSLSRLAGGATLPAGGDLEGVLAGLTASNDYQPELEAGKYLSLCKLLQLGNDQPPAGVEVLALDGPSQCRGFLVSGPEPIDWRRTSLKVSWLPASTQKYAPVAEATGPVKIIGFSRPGAGGDINQEWVDLLLLEALDTSGLIVENEAVGADGGYLTQYYDFGPEQQLPAGTVIRIHTGNQKDDPNPSPEMEHRYLGADKLQLSDTVKLHLFGTGLLHSRAVYDENAYQAKPCICVRSADNTGAFIFLPDGVNNAGGIEPGNYRFEFQFKRNPGNGLPVLKRLGLDTDEQTAIEFSYPALLPLS